MRPDYSNYVNQTTRATTNKQQKVCFIINSSDDQQIKAITRPTLGNLSLLPQCVLSWQVGRCEQRLS